MLKNIPCVSESQLLLYVTQNKNKFPVSFLKDLETTLHQYGEKDEILLSLINLLSTSDAYINATNKPNLGLLDNLTNDTLCVLLSLLKTKCLLPSDLLGDMSLQQQFNDVSIIGLLFIKSKELREKRYYEIFPQLSANTQTTDALSKPVSLNRKEMLEQFAKSKQCIVTGNIAEGVSLLKKLWSQEIWKLLNLAELIEMGKLLEKYEEGYSLASKCYYQIVQPKRTNNDEFIYASFLLARLGYKATMERSALHLRFTYNQMMPQCKAASSSHPEAKIMLAILSINGLPGIPPSDYFNAIHFLQEAAFATHDAEVITTAFGILAEIYVTFKEYSLARRYCKIIKNTANANAFYKEKALGILSWLYEKGYGCEKNITKASECYQLLEKNFTGGNGDVTFKLGVLAYEKGSQDSIFYERAWGLFMKTDSCRAQNNLGIMYASGTGVKKDMELACTYFRSAARALLPSAMRNLAFFYKENGGGSHDEIERLRKEAELWDSATDGEHGRDEAGYEFITELATPSYVKQGKLLYEKIIYFELIPVPLCIETYTDGWFEAIGIDRFTAIEALKMKIEEEKDNSEEDRKFTNLIASQICTDFLNIQIYDAPNKHSEFYELPKEMPLRDELYKLREEYSSYTMYAVSQKDQKASPQDLHVYENYVNEVLKLCKNPQLISWYLNLYDIDHRHSISIPYEDSTGMMDAIIELYPERDKEGICVWEIAGENRYQLMHWHKPGENSFHVLFENNSFARFIPRSADLTLADLQNRSAFSTFIPQWKFTIIRPPSAPTPITLEEPSPESQEISSESTPIPKNDKRGLPPPPFTLFPGKGENTPKKPSTETNENSSTKSDEALKCGDNDDKPKLTLQHPADEVQKTERKLS
jgi:TPR repeat protein